jgi:hypothetical protein
VRLSTAANFDMQNSLPGFQHLFEIEGRHPLANSGPEYSLSRYFNAGMYEGASAPMDRASFLEVQERVGPWLPGSQPQREAGYDSSSVRSRRLGSDTVPRTLSANGQPELRRSGRISSDDDNIRTPKAPVPSRTPIMCPIPSCGKYLCRQAYLDAHMAKHTRIRAFSCDVQGCAMSFRFKSNLNRYVSIEASYTP